MFVQGEKNKKKKRVSSEGSLHVQCSIFKRAFSGVAFRPSNLGLFGSSLQPGAREKKRKKKKKKKRMTLPKRDAVTKKL